MLEPSLTLIEARWLAVFAFILASRAYTTTFLSLLESSNETEQGQINYQNAANDLQVDKLSESFIYEDLFSLVSFKHKINANNKKISFKKFFRFLTSEKH